MEKFSYHARDRRGHLVEGTLEALNAKDLRTSLNSKNLILIKAEPYQEVSTSNGNNTFTEFSAGLNSDAVKVKIGKFFEPRLKTQDVLMFYQQLQTIFVVGMPLVRGLEVIATQCEHIRLKKVIELLSQDVSEGRSLSEAGAKYPDLFSNVALSLIAAGEASGRMDELLGYMVELARSQADNQAKINSTLFYPKMVLGMIVIVFIGVFYFVIPRISGFFAGIGAELPLITRIMVGISDILLSYWYLIVGSLVAIVVGIRKWLASPKGRLKWDEWKLKVPVFGPLLLLLDVYGFCSVFGVLLTSGLPITQALSAVRGTLSNVILQRDIELTIEKVRAGGMIHEGLNEAGHFPGLFRSFVALGEETGSMESALSSIGGYYKMQAEYKMSNLSKVLEPILLAVIFSVVLVLALAIFMPMWQMGSALKK